MTQSARIEKNIRMLDTALAMTRAKLIKSIEDGTSGVVVVKFPLWRGGIKNVTFGEEFVMDNREGERK